MCHYGRVTRNLDLSSLTAPIAKGEVAAFKAQTKASGKTWGQWTGSSVVGAVFLAFVVGAVLLSTGSIFLRFLTRSIENDGINPVSGVGVGFIAIFMSLVIIAIVVGVRGGFGFGKWTRWMRLDRFAQANDLVFSPSDSTPTYPGSIFGRGHSRVALDHLRSDAGRFLDYGNYRYVTGSGKNQTTHNWGFLAFKLDRQLPHMVLDSKANNGLFGGSNLGVTFTKDQILSLEGDFDRYFTLYCPSQYERDALYVFTPDLMALLIDEAAPFDVEIVDSWMFVYAARPFVMTDPGVHERLFRIVDTVGAKTLTQTERYADERVGDRTANIVAAPGRRLRSGVSIGTIIVVSVLVAYWGFSFFGSFLGFGN